MTGWTRVRKEQATGWFRVLCPVHGELARYRKYWPAAYDATAHNETCGAEDETGSSDSRGGVARRPLSRPR